jgi:hypothetical protein
MAPSDDDEYWLATLHPLPAASDRPSGLNATALTV